MSLFDPNRGRIPAPDLDDRKWKDIVDQATALIPRYAPQWTDHGPSDIGITLIELFAWLVEGLIYRLNQVPEKNYIAFLNLLGVRRNPPEPARAFLTFSASPSALKVNRGTQVQTAASKSEPPIVFETDEDVQILPINLKTAVLIGSDRNYRNVSTAFTAPPAKGQKLEIKAGETTLLCLGFDDKSAAAINLTVRLSLRLQQGQGNVAWLHSAAQLAPIGWPALSLTDGTNGLTQEGDAKFTAPADWQRQAPTSWGLKPASEVDKIDQGYFWIAISINNPTAAAISVGIQWILFNAVSAQSALTIPSPEPLGTSDGTPFQMFALANGPLYQQEGIDPYSHLTILVDGAEWRRVDDLPESDDAVYRLDPVTAEILLGNRNSQLKIGNGRIPPTGSAIVAQSYRYVAFGAAANVGAGTILVPRGKLPGIKAVTNLFAANGGADQEPLEDAKLRAPQLLRNRNRAVTQEDYEFLALESSTELASVRCLGPKYKEGGLPWTFGKIDRSVGNVTVIVLPKIAPEISERPQPSPELSRTVYSQLDRRRDIATRLTVRGPLYLPIDVRISIVVFKEAVDANLIRGSQDVHDYVDTRVRNYLHPVVGGLDRKGWKIGQAVLAFELQKAIAPPIEWGYISTLDIAPGTPDYVDSTPTTALITSPSTGVTTGPTTGVANGPAATPPDRPPMLSTPGRVQLADYELVCKGVVHITPQEPS